MAKVNAILIFLSLLKTSGIGAFIAKAEFHTVFVVSQQKRHKSLLRHTRAFFFCLHGTC